jgi:asparagine synthase (glutamine-hydrolysing)
MRDILEVSLPTLLRYEDANSMAHSIESRLPFMDHRVIELGVALPVTLKVRDGYGKWILREAVAGIVPDSIRRARFKRGFDVSGDWILGGLGEAIRQDLWRRADRVREWMLPGTVIDEAFSNRALRARGSAFAEATTLSWLARRLTEHRWDGGPFVTEARVS